MSRSNKPQPYNRPLRDPRVFVPANVQIAGDMLTWGSYCGDNPLGVDELLQDAPESHKPFTDRALLKFATLYKGEPDAIVQFAARNGVFGAELDDSVATPPGAALTARRAYVGFGRPAVAVDGQSWIVSGLTWYKSPRREPLSLWRFLSRRVDAILRISAALKGMCPLPIAGGEEWAALGWEKAPERVSSKFGSMLTQAFFGRTLDDSKKVIATAPASLSANFQNLRLGGRENLLFEATPNSDLFATQLLLGAVVNDWLKTGGVGLALAPGWAKTMWQVEVSFAGFYNLFGALAYRMFLTVAGEENLYVCDACKTLYIRTERAPSPGQENFCGPDCRKISMKRAVQRFRSSAKQKRASKKKRGTKG